MNKNLSRVIVTGLGAILSFVVFMNDNGEDITGCSDQFPEAEKRIVYEDVSDWLDAYREYFKKLSKSEGAPVIYAVLHHTKTSEMTTAKRLCEITDDRFSMGCSYANHIHELQEEIKILQVTRFDAYSASVGNNNSRVISIAFVGDFENDELSPDMLKAVCMIRYAFNTYKELNPDFNFGGFRLHNEFRDTKCPGKEAERQLREHGFVDTENINGR